jgi:hypothetical protein
MDNDLPAEPNDFMAATYADLAWEMRLRAEANPRFTVQAQQLESLAASYSERHDLSHGEKP